MKRHWQRAMAQARPLFRIARPILGAHWTLLVLCLGLSLLLTCLELLRPQALRLLFDGLLTPNAQQLPAFLRDMADREVWPWTFVRRTNFRKFLDQQNHESSSPEYLLRFSM